MSNTAIILAAGNGTRMKADKSKLLLEINGMTVIERTVKTFSKISDIDDIIVVVRESDIPLYEKVLSGYDISYCIGGSTRQESVSNAVETIDSCDMIIIHDGARPLVTEKKFLILYARQKNTVLLLRVYLLKIQLRLLIIITKLLIHLSVQALSQFKLRKFLLLINMLKQ